MTINNNTVAVEFFESKDYPRELPFNPPIKYPEYQGTELDPNNKIYDHVRQILYKSGLDKENFGTINWNPFKDIVKPGMTVFVNRIQLGIIIWMVKRFCQSLSMLP